ncbi:sucrase ferredoxin [Nocardioides speluncae]|uniref:sucrase ferredoxin n=1 Tax=Nocardioides speluncae TaxID=2670337 RepID=UPI000D68BCDC|nr:sucrase ferredoxin [Nocardioides speluncae]
MIELEPLAGTAPTDSTFLLVEYAGPWARNAVAESGLPDVVRAYLQALDGVRVQLIRRHGGAADGGVRIFAAHLGADETWIETTVLDSHEDLCSLDLTGLGAGQRPGLTPYTDHLWLVCTNGRRDLCCAKQGRPVAGALAAEWPAQTWETNHLGGHRFAATLLALPSGYCLGRLDEESAVTACRALAEGTVDDAVTRGRAGQSAAAQVAELAVRRESGCWAVDEVRVVAADGGAVAVESAGQQWEVEVATRPGHSRRQSCADLRTKPSPELVVSAVRVPVG